MVHSSALLFHCPAWASRHSRGVNHLHCRATFRAACDIHACIELLCQGVYDAGAQPGLRVTRAFLWPADPVVANRKRPVGALYLVCHDDAAVGFVCWKRMLEGID